MAVLSVNNINKSYGEDIILKDVSFSINKNDKVAGKVDYIDCTITTSNCEDDYVLEDTACEIKVRGNYTLNYDKKPLRLKFYLVKKSV